MLHHFDNSATLIRATVVELHERRLRAFRRTSETSQHDPASMISAYWKQTQKPAFAAFQELAMAARTNAELAKIMQVVQVEYRERFNTEAFALFPEWRDAPARFAQAMALSQTLIEGMAMSIMTGALDEAMVPPLLKMLEEQIRAMRPAWAPILRHKERTRTCRHLKSGSRAWRRNHRSGSWLPAIAS